MGSACSCTAMQCVLLLLACPPQHCDGCASLVQVEISFVINYCADYGQQVVLVGSSQELGSWDTAAAVRLAWQQGDNWKATVQLPAPERGCVLAAAVCSSILCSRRACFCLMVQADRPRHPKPLLP
eukprot:GHRQ01024878.1.p1 GENE.GHRQ01024878.1~~GHRQ01024878.1.p1  ORF type:complete len:126 (-),score=29.47 GHRQ01024878.1:173-550(-)